MTARARPPFDVELESALNAVPAFFTTLEPGSTLACRMAAPTAGWTLTPARSFCAT